MASKHPTTKTYLGYHNASGHQTWHSGISPQEPSTHKVLQLFYNVVLWYHLTNKTLHLHCHKADNHQTWQGGNLLWGGPTHKVTWSIDHMVLQDHVKNKMIFISTAKIPKGRINVLKIAVAHWLCWIWNFFDMKQIWLKWLISVSIIQIMKSYKIR